MKTNIKKASYFFFLSYLILIFTLIYWVVIKSDFLTTHPNNSRIWAIERNTIRGTIYDRNGKILAQNTQDENKRIYPYDDVTSHLIGYSSEKYGKTSLEDKYDSYLLGLWGPLKYKNMILNKLNKPRIGYDLKLTLDIELQTLAYNLLKDKKGALVALNPKTGQILASVSTPAYKPNSLFSNWDFYLKNENGYLLNRATQGVYPPGSVIKTAVAGVALNKNKDLWNEKIENNGSITVKGHTINDQIVRSPLNMKEALAYSSNVFFVRTGMNLGSKEFMAGLENFYFNKRIPFDLEIKLSTISKSKMNDNLLAETSIGQGEMTVTPMHMALITSAIANKGTMPEPYLVEQVLNKNGTPIKDHTPKVLINSINEESSQLVKEGMIAAVNEGTGKNAASSSYQVAGKTGSAQNPHGISHAWFVGFAPAENPEISIAIILENEGSGGANCAPIAKKVIDLALKR